MSSADEFVISSTVPLKIGFLGLGNMGSCIVSALLQSGHDVTVWNRTPSKVIIINTLVPVYQLYAYNMTMFNFTIAFLYSDNNM